MYRKLLWLGVVVFAAVFSQMPASGESLKDLNLMTEYYPPFNYEEDDEVKGISIDLLLAASKELNSGLTKADIQLMQWSPAYQKTLNEPGNLLFATTRTQARETIFKWAGPISATTIGLSVKKENNIIITSLDDIKQKNLKIGVVKDDVAEQLLLEAGVPAENIIPRPFPGLCLIDLFRNTIDAWGYEENVVMWMLSFYGFNSSEYESGYTISKGDLYYAFNKDVSDDVVDTLQKAIDEVKAIGEYDRIVARYR